MKKIILTLITALSITLYAAPGDTTWIQANNVKLNYYNNFDTAVAFPNGSTSYRKILMVFTLGEYACPAGSQYCHQWDYTVTNYVMTKTDTVELSRFITPYANTGVPRFPATWKQHYVYDVTDFYTLLKDSATIRIFYSGYSGGFTGNIKFAFIEGTPERNVLGVDPLWRGSYTYGNSADPIANHLPVETLTVPASTQSSELKLTVTGHGSDNTTQCCEFASHTYSITTNSLVVAQKAVWRDDCGVNELYAQGGTWIYNRGNWCPGDAVNTNTHPLAAATANTTYSLGLQFDAYTSTGNYGSYTIEGHVFYYGNFNHVVDASLNDIISPSNNENHYRENPAGNSPIVRIHNSGSSAINSVTFSYNVKDSVPTQYTWNGTLLPLQDTTITLDPLNTLTHMSQSGTSGTFLFNAKIIAVNGVPDEDSTNNTFQSQFVSAPVWPTSITLTLNTNSAGTSFVGDGDQSETTWQITDLNNNVIASRLVDTTNRTYVDTVHLAPYGFYKLSINDVGCDGLHWWVWGQNPSYGVTPGSFYIRNLNTGAFITMKGYYYSGTYNNDFGCNFTAYFSTAALATGIQNLAAKNTTPTLNAFPNPANDNVTVTIAGVESAKGRFDVIDGQGRLVLQQKAAGLTNTLSISSLSNGVYTILYNDAKVQQIQTRIFIVK